MAMEITNNYSNYTSGYASAANNRKQTAESKVTTQTGSICEAELSKGAQVLLEKLRKSYSDMDSWLPTLTRGITPRISCHAAQKSFRHILKFGA